MAPRSEPQHMVTLRMGRTAFQALQAEAQRRKTSMNKLSLRKLGLEIPENEAWLVCTCCDQPATYYKRYQTRDVADTLGFCDEHKVAGATRII